MSNEKNKYFLHRVKRVKAYLVMCHMPIKVLVCSVHSRRATPVRIRPSSPFLARQPQTLCSRRISFRIRAYTRIPYLAFNTARLQNLEPTFPAARLFR